MASRNRPLSPHLQIYQKQITSVMSILHRMSGVVLTFGAMLLANWVISATYGADAFAMAQGLLGSVFGRLVLLGVTLALFYHLGNGIRHLAWDMGKGFELTQVRTSGMFVIAFTVIMTVITWITAYSVAGGS
jgi:succinate dehydrogenase / fumarate reductase, cytochrome b subunit